MRKNFKRLAIWLIIIVAFVALLWFLAARTPRTPQYDDFARCLKAQGTVFYGAFWCPHCQNQKDLFGASAQYLPYVECSTPDGQGQLAVCAEEEVSGYPTWVFPDGSQLTGEVSLADLAARSGCVLPPPADSEPSL